MNTILLSSACLLALAFIMVTLYNYQMANKLRLNYRDALFGNDRERAIDAGRAYYTKVHGMLTQVEESAILRDLERNGLGYSNAMLNAA